jgi:hypothetical protein
MADIPIKRRAMDGELRAYQMIARTIVQEENKDRDDRDDGSEIVARIIGKQGALLQKRMLEDCRGCYDPAEYLQELTAVRGMGGPGRAAKLARWWIQTLKPRGNSWKDARRWARRFCGDSLVARAVLDETL